MAPSAPARGSPRLDLIERLLAAFNARDIDRLVAALHEDVEIWPRSDHIPAGMSYHGRAGLVSMLELALPAFPEVRVEDCEFTEFRDRVVAAIRVALDGREERWSFWVYSFRDGLVLRAEQYPSHEAALAAAERHVLTPRERQVLQLLARGKNGPEIAEELVLSPETVRTHVQNAVDRLGAATRVQAVAMAIDRGEIEP